VNVDADEENSVRARALPYTGWAGFHYDTALPRERAKALLIAFARNGIRMLMVYSPGETEAMFTEMTALTPEERADFETGKAVAARHNTVWVGE